MSYRRYETAKRAFDFLLALAALTVTLPLWLFVGAFIAIASPGGIFFVQHRVGRWGRPFRILKFRTMDCRPTGGDMPRGDAEFVTCVDDPRVFRGGGLLRRWKIDELPQLLNILAGSMSFVGPRPTVEADYVRMTPAQRRRADVLPGLTGLAQIHGGAGVPWPERLAWDLRYVDKRSIALDMLILTGTAAIMLAGRPPEQSSTSDEWAEAA